MSEKVVIKEAGGLENRHNNVCKFCGDEIKHSSVTKTPVCLKVCCQENRIYEIEQEENKTLSGIKKLYTDTLESKVLYDEAINLCSKESKQRYKENNLSIGNDDDIDEIVDIDMELSEKYNTDFYYKQYTENANTFILNGLDWTIDNRPANAKKSDIETVKELKQILKDDPCKLIIYRERLLDILLRFDVFQPLGA